MKISVVICVRNEGAAFARTVEFLSEQRRLHDLEVVIVDDASDEPVGGLRDDFLLIRNETRRGIASSRSIGAQRASGEILLFSDGHVFFSENALMETASVCDDRGIVGCKTQLMLEYGQFERRQTTDIIGPSYYGWRFVLKPEVRVAPIFDRTAECVYELPYVGSGFLAINRQLFWELGGFDDGLGQCGSMEDAELAMNCWALGCSVRIMPDVTLFHYTAPQGPQEVAGRSPLDVPRYDGSFQHALRAIYVHFPDDHFFEIMTRVKTIFPASWDQVNPSFPDAELRERKARLDSLRVRSREWVFERMIRA